MMSKELYSRIVFGNRVWGMLRLIAYFSYIAALVCVLLLRNIAYGRLGLAAHRQKCAKI